MPSFENVAGKIDAPEFRLTKRETIPAYSTRLDMP